MLAPRHLPASLLIALLCACSDDASDELDTVDATGDTDADTSGDAPGLASAPELVFHPNQPMIVDVLVELDRPGLVEAIHDDDPGVVIAMLSVEDEGRSHHLRARGLAPNTAHALTLTLADLDEPDASANESLNFITDGPLPGFQPTFEVELFDPQALDPAYRLFDYSHTPLWDPAGIYVIDTAGVSRWYYEGGPAMVPGPTTIWAGIELLDDGTILALRDGAITIVDELGEQRLSYQALDYGLAPFHHEVTMLANGNFLALGNSFADVDYSSLDPELGVVHVAGDLLVEIDPDGEIVWTWDAFDHLDPLRILTVPGEGLAYFDPDTGELGFDWTHGNGMVQAEDGSIMLSMRHQDWLISIDHATGEILWRLGREGDFELVEGTWFFHQHSPQWQPDGTLLVYDNAIANPDLEPQEIESRAVRYALDYEAMTAAQVWDSRHDEPVVSAVAGDADRTPNANVLVLDSTLQPDPSTFDVGKNRSRLTELAYEGVPSPIWSLTTKVGSMVYRATEIDRLPGE